MMDPFIPGSEEELPFEFRPKPLPPGKQTQHWKSVEHSIQQAASPILHNWRRNLAIAASLLAVVSVGTWFLQSNRAVATNLYSTDYAQVKNITLPDGSKVVLNANSQLKLSSDWGEKGDRQVWLEGEAYFVVEKKTATHQKFVVHTNDVDVEVLGTRFNVNTRHEKAIVSLEEGKIKLVNNKPAQTATQIPKATVIEMKPGELVKVDTSNGIHLSTEANIAVHSGWIRNEFHFDKTTLKEIAVMIKDLYGYTLVTADEQLLSRTITGDLRAANLQELVDVLQFAMKLKMTIEQKNITISRL